MGKQIPRPTENAFQVSGIEILAIQLRSKVICEWLSLFLLSCIYAFAACVNSKPSLGATEEQAGNTSTFTHTRLVETQSERLHLVRSK